MQRIKYVGTILHNYLTIFSRSLEKDPPKIQQWVESICEETSIHGFIWYTRIESMWYKNFVVVLCILTIFAIPFFTIHQSIEYYYDTQLITTTNNTRAEVIAYPTITICHPKYFLKQRMKGRKCCNNNCFSIFLKKV